MILFFRLIVTAFIGLFSTRFIVQGLGASDFGLYSVVGGLVVMMAFLNTIMTSTTYRYIAFEMGKGNNEGINKVFNISLVIHICLALFVILLTETAGVWYVNNHLNVTTVKVADALFVLRFSTYATIFSILSIPYQGLVTAHEKFTIHASIEIIRSLLVFFVALAIIYYTGNRLRLYALLIASVNIVPALLFFAYCTRKYSEITKWSFQRGISKYKEMIGFSGWIMIGAAASVGQTSGAALIINSFFGTMLNAAFGIANQVNSIVLMFARNLAQAATPQITKSFSSGNTDRTISLTAYISKYTVFFILLPALPMLLDTDFLLTLWLGEVPPFTVIFCQLILLNALISSLGSGLPALIQATGKIKYFQLILSTTSLLSLPIAYILFQAGYKPPLIIIAFISTAMVNIILWQVLLKKIIDFNVGFFLKTSYLKILYVCIFISPLFLMHGLFKAGILRFVCFSSFAIGWLATAIYFIGLEGKEKTMIKDLFRTIVKSNGFNNG